MGLKNGVLSIGFWPSDQVVLVRITGQLELQISSYAVQLVVFMIAHKA